MNNTNEEVVDQVLGLLNDEDGGAREEPPTSEAPPAPPAPEDPEDVNDPEAPEAPEDAEEQEDAADTAAPEAEESSAVPTISDLAEFLQEQGADVTVEDLYGLSLPVTTPEGLKSVTIGEWKDGYQAAEVAKAEAARVAEEAGRVSTQLRQQQEIVGRRLMELDALAQTDEGQLAQEVQKINWDDLRENDPAEYAVRRREYDERFQALHQRRQYIAQQFDQQTQQVQAQQAHARKEMLEREQDALMAAIPTWSDAKVAQAEKSQLVGYLKNEGYEIPEIESLIDHRAVKMIRKAMLYDGMKTAKPETKKVFKIGSRVFKPGPGRSQGAAESEGFRKGMARFKKAGGRDTGQAVDLVEKHFLGDLD